MKYFPGRSVDEIMNLAADMKDNCSNPLDMENYAARLKVDAERELAVSGPITFFDLGYSLDTVVGAAETIASHFATFGAIDIS